MKYKNTSLPIPSVGQSYLGEKEVLVPDQSMSLQEILARFTRGEAVPAGHETSEGIQDEDLEKLKFADLVDKAEYIERLQDVKKKHERQEADKANAEKEKAEKAAKSAEEKRIRLAAQKLAKQNLANSKGST